MITYDLILIFTCPWLVYCIDLFRKILIYINETNINLSCFSTAWSLTIEQMKWWWGGGGGHRGWVVEVGGVQRWGFVHTVFYSVEQTSRLI